MTGGVEESSNLSVCISMANQPTNKRLLFDRRYGWIGRFDDWKEPSEEALAGGRGMFCVVPIGKGILKMVSQSINFAIGSLSRVLESPEQMSLQALHGSLSSHWQKFSNITKMHKVNLLDIQTGPSTSSLQENTKSSS
ncbi:hypothetical protein HPP92_012157 [Vanilla planifolia]|uniref:Uncharacterized protein n=1 Tax=Vanilla planifolia TaxID=51239 RepID=A0A835V469_VANPL|nr:hypothetical protein HPP92_012157 [Vanilla planifolia]